MKCICDTCRYEPKSCIDRCQLESEKYAEKEVIKFADWLPQHFDLRFSNNPDVWLDEYFNHTREKVLAEWQKGKKNE